MEVDESRARALARELELMRFEGGCTIHLHPLDAFTLIGLLQLAYRNPQLNDSQRRMVELSVQQMEPAFRGKPVARSVIAEGWGSRPWVRACRRCGCTEEVACMGGCSWVPGLNDVCSVCAEPEEMG